MKKKSGYLRRLFGILMLVLALSGMVAGETQVFARTSKTVQAQSAKKKKNKKNKKNNQQKTTEKTTDKTSGEEESEAETEPEVLEEEEYTSKEEVALYLHLFGHLPDNFITKKEARELGWVSKEGNLNKVAPGKSIGGDYFGNYEGTLPEVKGRKYYECDIDSTGGYRGAKRIIYSNDGWIYYTEDHYETFEELYAGEED